MSDKEKKGEKPLRSSADKTEDLKKAYKKGSEREIPIKDVAEQEIEENGLISFAICVSAARQCFVGWHPEDRSLVHVISYRGFSNSVWLAINVKRTKCLIYFTTV